MAAGVPMSRPGVIASWWNNCAAAGDSAAWEAGSTWDDKITTATSAQIGVLPQPHGAHAALAKLTNQLVAPVSHARS
jgi:hypothetical protein